MGCQINPVTFRTNEMHTKTTDGNMKTLVLLCLCIVSALSVPYRPLGQFHLKHAAFFNIFSLNPERKPQDLWITTFTGTPFASGSLFRIKDIGSDMKKINTSVETQLITNKMKWPNLPLPVSRSIFGVDAMILHDGFLVPTHTTGGVYIITFSRRGTPSQPVMISKKKNGYFYHMSQWIDMNGDGKLDVLTARAHKGLIGKGTGELLWLEQPTEHPLDSGSWKEHVITAGPDVAFKAADLDGDSNTLEIVACQFFTKKLTILQLNMTDGTLIQSRTIDDTIGAPFLVEFVDINVDGKLDLLVTNHDDSEKVSAVFAYELPSDLFKGPYIKHVLADGFKTTAGGSNQASPGFVYSFQPRTTMTGAPHLLLAGDGAQSAYYFEPTGEFTYKKHVVIEVKGIVGSIGVGDVDEDGYTDFFVPNYTTGDVYAYTFAP